MLCAIIVSSCDINYDYSTAWYASIKKEITAWESIQSRVHKSFMKSLEKLKYKILYLIKSIKLNVIEEINENEQYVNIDPIWLYYNQNVNFLKSYDHKAFP